MKEPLKVGQIRNIIISDIVASGCGKPRVKEEATLPASITGLPGHLIRGVTLSNFRVSHLGGNMQPHAEIKLDQIPEAPGGYPEFDIFGDLPCYGLFCRHVEGLTLRGVEFECETPDARPAFIGDDVPGLRQDGPMDRSQQLNADAKTRQP